VPTLAEKLEALPQLDPLAAREEEPLGGNWGETGGSEKSTGKVTFSGWTPLAAKEAAGATWQPTFDTRIETAVGYIVGALPAIGQFITLGFKSGGFAALGLTSEGWTVYMFFAGEFLGEVSLEGANAGEAFWIESDAYGCRLLRRKPGSGSEIEVASDNSGIAEAGDGGAAEDRFTFTFEPEGNSSTSVRITNFVAGPVGEPAVNTSAPTTSGTPEVGSTLSCDKGTWEGASAYGYMWQVATGDGWLNTAGSWSGSTDIVVPTYTAGRQLRCVVRALGGSGYIYAESEPVDVSGTLAPAQVFAGEEVEDYSYIEEAEEGRISEVLDPLGSGETVFSFKVLDGDVYPKTSTENPRAKLEAPVLLVEGSEIWLRWAFLLPEDFPDVPEGGWVMLVDYWGAPFLDAAPWKIAINGDTIRFQRNSTYDYDVAFSMPVTKGQWISGLTHLVFSEGGSLEMWIDGEQVIFFDPSQAFVYNPSKIAPTVKLEMATRDFSVSEGPVGPSISQYRKVGMFEEATVYFKPLEMWLDLGPPLSVVPGLTIWNGSKEIPTTLEIAS
jgi:Polysaccharide lyase